MKKILPIGVMLICIICPILFTGCCSHDWAPATCKDPETCRECGETRGETLAHTFEDATCVKPQTCSECGKTEGEALGHDFLDATCTQGSTCSRCEKVKGEPLEHEYAKATCTEPSTCSLCGDTKGKALGHILYDATCTSPAKCATCGYEEGELADHKFSGASCTSPSKCVTCGFEEGEALGHDYADATCTQPSRCTRCGIINESEKTEPLGHSYKDGKCKRCEAVDPDTIPDSLNSTHVIDSASYLYSTDGFTDSFGNTYRDSHGYSCYYHYYYYGEKPESYSIHNLNKKYSTFSGSIVAADGCDSRFTARIEIYADDKLVFSYDDFKKTTGKVDFSVKVKDCTKLQITLICGEDESVDSGYNLPYNIHLVDTKLTKK